MESLEEFKKSLSLKNPPAELSASLKALWYDANEDWDKAHDQVDSGRSKEEAWVHAYLHRKEGDISNANYWYSRAGKTLSKKSLVEEWSDIVSQLLN